MVSKMDSKTIDYYLEDLTESGYNTKLIKNKREIHTNVCFHVRKNSTQLFYEYGIEKIHRFKAFLKCRVAKCKSRLIVNYGDALTTKKILPKTMTSIEQTSKISS